MRMARTVVATVTRLVSWVRPPTACPMAVRLPLLLTGKPVHQTRGEVRRSERQQLPLGVDALVASVREGAPGQDVVGVADEGHAQRRRDQRQHAVEGHVRQRRDRQTVGDRADHR